MDTIDARGRSCPEPVLMTKKALASGAPRYTVLVDSPVAKENVARFAAQAGYSVDAAEADGEYTLTLEQKA